MLVNPISIHQSVFVWLGLEKQPIKRRLAKGIDKDCGDARSHDHDTKSNKSSGHLPSIETICAWVHSDPPASWGSTCIRSIWLAVTLHLMLLPSADMMSNWQSTWRSSTWKPIVMPIFIIHRQGWATLFCHIQSVERTLWNRFCGLAFPHKMLCNRLPPSILCYCFC